jgi:rubrerythrin
MEKPNFFTANTALIGKEILDVECLELMYQLECSGEVFYNMLADRMPNPVAAELLRRNAVEEKGHARRLARALSIKLGHEWAPSAKVAEILDIPLPDVLDERMFRAIVKGEINGDAGYQRWADAEPDEEVARLLRLNGREETIHAGRAQQVAEMLAA